MAKKNVIIYVAGQRFSISTADTPEYVIGIGEKIDVMIKGIQKDNPKLNRDACAILTALNICDDETKLRQMMEVLRGQVKDYLDQNEKLRAENDALKEELKALKEAKEAKTAEVYAKPEKPAQNTSESYAPKASVTRVKKEEAPAVQKYVAFSGKNFPSDAAADKKNQNKHNTPTPNTTPAAPAASTAAADPDDATADDASPYHQFSIFDDLI